MFGIEREMFLEQNPHIKKMLCNDTTLANIATIQELKNLNLAGLPLIKLCSPNEISFSSQPTSVEEFASVLLYMVSKNMLQYKLDYKNLNCSEYDIKMLLDNIDKAFGVVSSRYIEFFSGLSAIHMKTDMKMYGSTIVEVKLALQYEERYHGALNDTQKMIKMCGYVINELVRYGKITNNMRQYDMAKVLFNWTVLHIKYDNNYTRYGFTGYSGMAYGYAVCQGFTAVYNALCKCVGISIVGMEGKGAGHGSRGYENHIWSFALLDNRNVYIDVTWGSPEFEDVGLLRKYKINERLLCDFSKFDISYRELEKDHKWDKTFYG